MPRIREYSQQSNPLGAVDPRLVGDDGDAGRAIENAGRTISSVTDQLYKITERKEVSQLNADMSDIQAKGTVALQERIRKGENPETVVADTLKTYDDSVNKLQDGISTAGGRNYFRTSNATLRNHFFEQSVKGQAELAGEKTAANYKSSVTNMSSAIRSSPGSFDVSLQMNEQALDAAVQTGGMDQAVALKLKEESQTLFAKSSAKGYIDLNPTFARKLIADGAFDKYLDGVQKDALLSEADVAIKAKDIESDRAIKESERALDLKRTERENEFIKLFGEGKLSTKQIIEDPVLKPTEGSGSKKAFLAMIEADNKSGGVKTDRDTFLNIFSRITLEDGDPKKITDENELNSYMAKGLLSKDDLQFLRNEMQGKKTVEGGIDFEFKKAFLSEARRRLTKSNDMTGVKDLAGDAQYVKFIHYALPAIQNGIKSGKTMEQLTNPDSPDYVGKILDTPAYYKTRNQIIQGNVRGYRPTDRPPGAPPPVTPATPVTPRLPGETLPDYIKRTGVGK